MTEDPRGLATVAFLKTRFDEGEERVDRAGQGHEHSVNSDTPRPWIAVVLSALAPGLGNLYAGAPSGLFLE